MGRGFELGFEVVGRLVAERRVAALGIVGSHVVADFERSFGQPREAAAIGPFAVEAAPKLFGVGRTRQGVIVAVAPPAHARLRPVAGKQLLEAGGRAVCPGRSAR